MDAGLLVSILATAVAVVGVIMASRQIQISLEMRAQDAYESYHHLGLHHADISTGSMDWEAADEKDRVRYTWFVLSMLLTVERILTLFPNDKHWRAALEDDIVTHSRFIASKDFAPHRASLDPKVVKLIDSALMRLDANAG